MKTLLVFAGIFGMAWGTTTTGWPFHDCTTDHEIDPDDPHGFLMMGSGKWNKRTCFPAHLVYQHEPNCKCVWPDKELTYGDCNTVNKPVPGEPAYIFQYWHPVDNVWYNRNCHDVFPPSYHHNNDQLFFNVTSCACDWRPAAMRGPLTVDPAADCTSNMDILMVDTPNPPLDLKGNFVQPYNPVWKVWPPTVPLEAKKGLDAVCFNATRLKSWYLTGNRKPNIWFYFALCSNATHDTSNFRCVLSNGCDWGGVHPATFQFWYRANPIAFRVEYSGTTWECEPGGNGIDSWVEVALFFGGIKVFPVVFPPPAPPVWTGPWPALFVGGVNCNLRVVSTVVLNGDYFGLPVPCQLNLGGNELEPNDKYTGCMSRFQVMSGQC